jgi:DNA invertase Pin-like site-specific DNA recombinase
MPAFTGRLMLAVLGGLADVERDLIRTRTAEGRSRAKAQGKHMGRRTGPFESFVKNRTIVEVARETRRVK